MEQVQQTPTALLFYQLYQMKNYNKKEDHFHGSL